MKMIDPGLRLTPLGKQALVAGALALSIATGVASGAHAHCANPVTLKRHVTSITCTRLGRCVTSWDVRTGGQYHTVYALWWGKQRIKLNDAVSVSACLSPHGGSVKGKIGSVSR